MGEALGMIETRGMVAMIEASDAMVKAAKDSRTPRRWRGCQCRFKIDVICIYGDFAPACRR